MTGPTGNLEKKIASFFFFINLMSKFEDHKM